MLKNITLKLIVTQKILEKPKQIISLIIKQTQR